MGGRARSALFLVAVTLVPLLHAVAARADGAEGDRPEVVLYLAGSNPASGGCQPAGCQWRIYDPRGGSDRLLLALPGMPEDAFWDSRHRFFYYQLAGSLHRSEWRHGATPETVLELPDVLGADRITLDQRLERMRITRHLAREGQDATREGERTLHPRTGGGSTLRVRLSFGDSAHAIAPLRLFLPSGKERPQPLAFGCSRQIAFEDVDGFLLVTTERSGSCARIVHLPTGQRVRTLPADSRWASWVPAPQ